MPRKRTRKWSGPSTLQVHCQTSRVMGISQEKCGAEISDWVMIHPANLDFTMIVCKNRV
jgi:hypothetical protein